MYNVYAAFVLCAYFISFIQMMVSSVFLPANIFLC